MPNLAPQVESVDISRLTSSEKRGVFKISYKAEDQNEEQDSVRTKYLASLWMIASVTGVMQQEEIAQQAGVSSILLQRWEEDKLFNLLVEYNYQEFLVHIVNLFT